MASGVLLAGSLVHQLPDSIENLENIGTDFPLATFVAGLTFCLFLVMEEYLHSSFDDNPFEEGHHHHGEQGHDHAPSFHYPMTEGEKEDEEEEEKIEMEIRRLLIEKSNLQQKHQSTRTSLSGIPTNGKFNSHDIANPHSYRRSSVTFICTSGRRRNKSNDEDFVIPSEVSALFPSMSIDNRGSVSGHGMLSIQRSVRPSLFNTLRKSNFEEQHPMHHHDDHLAEHMHGSLLASIILLLALSIHSIFEGLAIGVSPNMTEVTSTAAAVLAHKAFAGYALGSSMIASQMNDKHFFILVFVFASCSIMGILLGMLFEKFTTSSNLGIVTGVIQAMVAGTFLYVSIVEVGMKEVMMHREQHSDRKVLSVKAMEFWKLASFMFGYLCMSALAIWV